MKPKFNFNILIWAAVIGGGYFLLKPIVDSITGADKKKALDVFNNGDEWDNDFGVDNDKVALNNALRAGTPYSAYANNLIDYLATTSNSADFNKIFTIISKMRSKSELSWLSRTYTALNSKGHTLAQDLIGQEFGHGLTWSQNKKITDLTSKLKPKL